MANEIETLQNKVADHGVSVTALLQKALVLANKMADEQFLAWARQELKGYTREDKEVDYRCLKGHYVAITADGRRLPIHWQSSTSGMNVRFITLPLPELESLMSPDSSSFAVKIKVDSDALTSLDLEPGDCIGFEVGQATSVGFLQAIRNRILEWTLDLSTRSGVVGATTDSTGNNTGQSLRVLTQQSLALAPAHISEAVGGLETSCSNLKKPKIFISYRRTDSAYSSQSIYDKLISYYGKESVFFDVDTIPVGQDFHKILNEAVAKCNVFLAVIGDHWLNTQDENGLRRLDNPDDFVRIEIEAALSRNISVIPVLTGLAKIPRTQDLPSTLHELSRRQATEVRAGRDFRSHLDRLIRDIQQVCGVADPGGINHHSIRFNVDDWTVWQEPDYDPDFPVISQWRTGDIRYSCTIRLRNDLEWDDELHRLRMEFRQGDNVLLEDTYAFDDDSVVLPPRKWVSINVYYGVHEEGVFSASDSVWFVAETVGDNSKVAWLVEHPTHGGRSEVQVS